ncbi:STAS domain-containing protein [Actinokineospora bangkokensis]|uniref:STAS domain-containing protein n=1 Tax=Actinokineospora bangkokensis TaxID=1193682 RepID=A0A1Q9LP78_9PSEU|nr:STAS domain-containing protein [Actinokineospora bangkokensis]OLR93803.1 hypothetical protein BJP25_16330 [Actinokineospora bangkokensis]
MTLKFARTPRERAERSLTVTTTHTAGTTTITAHGRIDLATEAPWREALITTATTPDPTTHHLVVDLTAVTHLSWASTAVLLRAHRACTRRGRTLTTLARGPILSSLHLTPLAQELRIAPSTTTAPTPHTHSTNAWLIA